MKKQYNQPAVIAVEILLQETILRTSNYGPQPGIQPGEIKQW